MSSAAASSGWPARLPAWLRAPTATHPLSNASEQRLAASEQWLAEQRLPRACQLADVYGVVLHGFGQVQLNARVVNLANRRWVDNCGMRWGGGRVLTTQGAPLLAGQRVHAGLIHSTGSGGRTWHMHACYRSSPCSDESKIVTVHWCASSVWLTC